MWILRDKFGRIYYTGFKKQLLVNYYESNPHLGSGEKLKIIHLKGK